MDTTIIGGADGPTAIFLSAPVNWLLIAGAVIVACGVGLIFLFRAKRK